MDFTEVSSKRTPDVATSPEAPDSSRLHIQFAQIALESARMCALEWDMVADSATYVGDPRPIFGCVPAADYKSGFRSLVHSEDVERVEANIRRFSSSDELFEDEFRVVHPDASIHWIRTRGRFVRDSAGRPIRLIGVNVDVTEEKERDKELVRARAAVQSQHALLDTLVHHMPAMLCYMREPGRVHWVNRPWIETLGWMPEDTGGDMIQVLYPDPDEAERVREFVRRADGTVGEFKTRTKDGRTIDTAWVNVTLADGTNIGIGRDITDQKKAVSELRESERRFRMISDNIPQLVWITDAAGATVYYNQRWYDYTGQAPDRASGYGWHDVMHADDIAPNQAIWDRVAREGGEFENELRIRRHDGEFRWFLVRAIPIRGERGEIENWFGTSTDITDQRLANEALVRAEKLAMAGRFASSVAHEINNPLTALTNIHYLLAQDETVPEHIRASLRVADGELRRISHILRQTLAFYREHARHEAVRPLSLMEELQFIFGQRLQSRGIALRIHIPDWLALWASPGEVRQVLCNLVANALDAVGRNGRVTIRAQQVRRGDGIPVVRITVADDGCGFAREHADRIFEPFFTTKNEFGTGLGLWVSKQLVERNHGTIRAKSRPGRGTVFSMEFPAATAQEPEREPQAEPEAAAEAEAAGMYQAINMVPDLT